MAVHEWLRMRCPSFYHDVISKSCRDGREKSVYSGIMSQNKGILMEYMDYVWRLMTCHLISVTKGNWLLELLVVYWHLINKFSSECRRRLLSVRTSCTFLLLISFVLISNVDFNLISPYNKHTFVYYAFTLLYCCLLPYVVRASLFLNIVPVWMGNSFFFYYEHSFKKICLYQTDGVLRFVKFDVLTFVTGSDIVYSFIQYSVWRQVQSLLQNDASI